MEITISKEELMSEVRYSLPKNILNNVNNLAIQNPYNHDIYYLKMHDKNIHFSQYEPYSKKMHPLHPYNELHKKSILLHPSVLHPRSRMAFEELARLSNLKG